MRALRTMRLKTLLLAALVVCALSLVYLRRLSHLARLRQCELSASVCHCTDAAEPLDGGSLCELLGEAPANHSKVLSIDSNACICNSS